MRKSLILMVLVIVCGCVLLGFIGFRNSQNNNMVGTVQIKDAAEKDIVEKNLTNEILDSSDSSIKLVPQNELESGIYDEKQVFIDNIDLLYNDYSFQEVEIIKSDIITFVHQAIDENILDIVIIPESVYLDDGILTFKIALSNQQNFTVHTQKVDDIKNIKITITNE